MGPSSNPINSPNNPHQNSPTPIRSSSAPSIGFTISAQSQNNGNPSIVNIVDENSNQIGVVFVPESLSQDGNTLEISFVSPIIPNESIASTIVDITLLDSNSNSITKLSENIEICLKQNENENIDVC